MIEFVFGQSREAKTGLLLQKMRERLESGKKLYLIIPEQQALLWDTLTASSLPPAAALSLETVSFTRLADSLFRRFGGCAKNYVTDSKKALIMWKAIMSVKDSLTVFGTGREYRYASVLLDAVKEARLYSVTPEKLLCASDALDAEGKGGQLADRLRDLSLIWAAYDKLLHAEYDDPEEIPDALCRLLDEHNCFAGCDVFLDSFYTLTPKEKNILMRIIRDADSVTVTFPLSPGDRDGIHTYHVRSFKNEVAELARRMNREIKATDAGEADKPEAIQYLAHNLWEHGAKPFGGDASPVELYTCGDRHDEAAVCAQRIWELVRQGAHFSDIAVVAADPEALRGICDVHLEAMGIPVYMSVKNDMASRSALRLILSACSTAAYGWRREDIIACAKTGLTRLTPDESDALQKYTDKWRLRGKAMFCCDGWSMNPEGYTAEMSDWGRELLKTANCAREKLIPPIERFCEAFTPGATVADACRAAFELLCDFSVYDTLQKEAQSLRRAGKGARAQETEQLWDKIIEILDTMVSAAKDTPADPAGFAAMLRRCAENTEVGTIPDTVDRVVIAGAGSARLDGVKHMIILGAAEGEFPAVPGDNGFFCERDKELLAPLGIKLSPGLESRRSEELFRFHAAVCAPGVTLSVIIPQKGDGARLRPSSGAERIMLLLPGAKIHRDADRDITFMLQTRAAAAYYLPSLRGSSTAKAAAEAAGIADREPCPIADTRDCVKPETADTLFPDRLTLSQSRLETFGDCPFSYYCKYVLRLDDGEEAKISPAQVGNFVHKILELFLRNAVESGKTFPLDEKESEEYAERLIRDYTESLHEAAPGKRLDYIFSRVSRSIKLYIKALSEEFAQSDFKPWGFEVPVGFDDSLPPLEIPLSDGGTVCLRGIIDRLDVYRSDGRVYIRVADYKTGAKSFHLDEVLQGRNVQLLLYLFSVCGCPPCSVRQALAPNGEELLPAGAVYFSARPGDAASGTPVDGAEAEKIAANAISRQGIILKDEKIIRAMEKDVQGKYIPVKIKADGSLSAYSSTADSLQMEEIKKQLCEALQNIGKDIKTGRAWAQPSSVGGRSPCDFCKMQPLCRRSKDGGAHE